MTSAPRRQNRDGCFQECQISSWLQFGNDAPAATFNHNEIDDKCAGKDIDVDVLANTCHQGPLDLCTSGIAPGMEHTATRVRCLAPQQDFTVWTGVESSS